MDLTKRKGAFSLLQFLALAVVLMISCRQQEKEIETIEELSGSFSVTEQMDVQIFPDKDSWLFRIGDGDPAKAEPAGEKRWVVPELDIELYGTKNGEGYRNLHLKRYGETVSLAGEANQTDQIFAQKSTAEIIEAITPKLMMIHNVPGVSVAVIQNEEISYLAQFGLKTAGQEPPVTENTIFEAASMSKPVFAYVVLQLAEEGLLDLDTPLVEYLGKPYIENDERHKKITGRMVLSHTSGFPNWRSGGWRKGGPVSILFEPGTGFRYSGEGFLFLQKVVEKLTRTSLDELMEERLLKPLGMNHSSYVWQDSYDSLAAGGHYNSGLLQKNRSIYHDPNAAFTLYTTPADYAKFLIEMMKDDRTAGHSLNKASITHMLSIQSDAKGRTPLVRRGGETGGTVHFGLGWKIEAISSGSRINHTGSNGTGFRCLSEFNPQTKNGIVIMTNGRGGSKLRTELMRYAGEE